MTNQNSDTIELGHVFRTIVRGWRAVAAFTLLGIVVATLIILFAPRKYTAGGTIVIKPDASGSGSSLISQVTGLSDVTAGLLSRGSSLETEIGVLSSRAVIGEVVDSLRLQGRMRAPSPVPTADLLSGLAAPGSFEPRVIQFSRAPDGAYRAVGEGVEAEMTPGKPYSVGVGTLTFSPAVRLPAKFALELRDREDAIDRVAKHFDISKQKGELASIKYAADDSITAARASNLLVQVYLKRRKGMDRGVNQRRVEFLTLKADSMDRELARAAEALRRQQESSGVLDPVAVARIDLESSAALQGKLTDVLVEQTALQQLMSQIASHSATPRQLAAYPTFLKSPAINNLVVQLSDLETKRSQVLTNRTETDREVVALDRSIASVEGQLMPFAETYAASLATQRRRLEMSADSVRRSLAGLPRAAESGGRLQRDVMDLAKLSAGLQVQLVEARLAAIGEGGDVRPLDVAVPPKKPSFPKPLLTASVGTASGLFLGMIAALLVGSVGRWVRDPVDLERTTGVPAIQFDPSTPLLLASAGARTLVVAPVVAGLDISEVVTRLAQTATWRSVSAAVLNLTSPTPTDVNASIARLEEQHDLVIVQLPSLVSDSAAAALQQGRPVLLVTPSRRTERRGVVGAVGMLRRLGIPCAGIVMNAEPSVALKAGEA